MVKYKVISTWVKVVVTGLIYVVVIVPATVIYAPRLFAQSTAIGLGVILIPFLFTVGSIGYNVWLLRRRNWEAPQVEQQANPIVAPAAVIAAPMSPQTAGASSAPSAPVAAAAIGSTTAPVALTSGPEPKVELAVPGVMKSGVVSYGNAAVTPEIQHPENTLLITDQALCFIYVPMVGADNQFTNAAYITSEFDKKGILEKLQSLLAAEPVSKIVSMDSRNWVIPYSEVSNIHLSNLQRTIKVERSNGDSRTYMIGRNQYWDQLKQILSVKGYSV